MTTIPRLTRRQLLWSAALAAASLPLAGCARQPELTSPPGIRYGEDICVACGMIISDPAFASAYRVPDGEARLFDDTGEMIRYQQREAEPAVAYFVHHYQTRAWLQAENAFYVQSQQLQTPMGFGVAALADEAEARVLAERLGGRSLSFGELQQADLPGRMPMRPGRH